MEDPQLGKLGEMPGSGAVQFVNESPNGDPAPGHLKCTHGK